MRPFDLPPMLSGDAEQQMKQMREYMTRVAMQLNEEEPAPQQVITQPQTVKKSNRPFALDESQFLKIYPVGSIYLSVSQTDPATLFGGTWQRIKDRFLLAAGDTYEVGDVGGEAEHELTVDEMPEHEHVEEVNYTAINSGSSRIWAFVTNDSATKTTSTTHFYGFSNPSGGSQAHNNMPPYLAVYVWQRTA